MSFQPHKTPEEKAMRRIKYWLLRTCRKDLTISQCHRVRDWRPTKFLMVIRWEATPV